MSEEESEYEERTYFVGCACEHDSHEHQWGGGCQVDGCKCEGGWEE